MSNPKRNHWQNIWFFQRTTLHYIATYYALDDRRSLLPGTKVPYHFVTESIYSGGGGGEGTVRPTSTIRLKDGKPSKAEEKQILDSLLRDDVRMT